MHDTALQVYFAELHHANPLGVLETCQVSMMHDCHAGKRQVVIPMETVWQKINHVVTH